MDFTNHHLILVRHYYSGGLALIFIGFGLLTTGLVVVVGNLALSENFYYDLISLERNPRITDAVFIIDGLIRNGNQYFGIGFGNLLPLIEDMSWRDYYPVSNQLWLQLVGNFGWTGLIVAVVLIGQGLKSVSRIEFVFWVLLLLSVQLHNSFFMSIFWTVTALGLSLSLDRFGNNKVLEQNTNNIVINK